jgi:hypothetical protein
LDLGFRYVPGSIRARLGEVELVVEERDPSMGRIVVQVSEDAEGEVTIDYERPTLRGGSPRPDKELGIADACIYLGADAPLSDERIFPYALKPRRIGVPNQSLKSAEDSSATYV